MARTPATAEPETEDQIFAEVTPMTPKVVVRQCATSHRPDDKVEVPHLAETTDFGNGDRIFETIQALRRKHQVLTRLEDYRIVCFWVNKAIKRNGKEQYGSAQKPAGLLKYLTQDADFVVIMSTEACRDLPNWEFEAAVCHQLLHCGEIESEDRAGDTTSKPGMLGHDFEGFIEEISLYGFWSAELRGPTDAFAKQLKLDLVK